MERITGSTSAELRDKFVERALKPLVARAFKVDADVQSVIFAVAQFYADEAEDQVHMEFVPCAERNPVWPDCLADPRFYATEEDFIDCTQRTENLFRWELQRELPQLDDDAVITAFAPYCLEESDQEMSMEESFVPYAILRRPEGDKEITVEIVGKMHQPAFEDRFDVGTWAPDPDAFEPPSPTRDDKVGIGSFRAWLRKMFG